MHSEAARPTGDGQQWDEDHEHDAAHMYATLVEAIVRAASATRAVKRTDGRCGNDTISKTGAQYAQPLTSLYQPHQPLPTTHLTPTLTHQPTHPTRPLPKVRVTPGKSCSRPPETELGLAHALYE